MNTEIGYQIGILDCLEGLACLASDDDLQNAVLICGWIEQTTARLRLAKRGEDLQLLAEKLILNLGHEMFTTLYARGASHASGDGWNRSSYR